MCTVTSGRHKIPTARSFAAAVLTLGLLAPGPTTTRWSDDTLASPALVATPLAEARPPAAPTGGSTTCGSAYELRFGWIDSKEEILPPTPRGAAACVAVYHLPDAARLHLLRQ